MIYSYRGRASAILLHRRSMHFGIAPGMRSHAPNTMYELTRVRVVRKSTGAKQGREGLCCQKSLHNNKSARGTTLRVWAKPHSLIQNHRSTKNSMLAPRSPWDAKAHADRERSTTRGRRALALKAHKSEFERHLVPVTEWQAIVSYLFGRWRY